MRLGAIIRRWRKVEDLTVRDVAQRIGLDPSTYVRFELGKNPSAETLAAVITWVLERTEK